MKHATKEEILKREEELEAKQAEWLRAKRKAIADGNKAEEDRLEQEGKQLHEQIAAVEAEKIWLRSSSH